MRAARREWLVLAGPSQERALARHPTSRPRATAGLYHRSYTGERMSQRRSGEEQQAARRLARQAYYRQDGLCFWCGQPMALLARVGNLSDPPNNLMTADHVIPYRNGGRARAGNIVAACASCNSSRDRAPRGGRYTAGDTTPASPFEVLQAWDNRIEPATARPPAQTKI